MSEKIVGNLQHTQFSHCKLPYLHKNDIMPVLIIGMHNSGTSILAELIHKGGVFLGNNMSHYESHFFSIFINDLLIMKGGNNWAKLPIMSIDEVLSFKGTIGPFIKKYWIADYLQWGYDGISKWGIKDPRISVLLPLYLEIFPNAKIVHIKRDPNDVAASLCQRSKRGTGVVNDFNFWKKLAEAYVERISSCKEKIKQYYELSYEDLCKNKYDCTKKLFNYLDISFTNDTHLLLKKIKDTKIGSYEKYIKNNARK